ncbi:MAG: four-helix bundle copper-binding protein [Alphaproteobacteria bacterium]|nr:four-helix bundle copper-binding protein [Alphaproteobacteria bacterium]MBV8411246.1 four-helix bundle copper-binding protein [Alphaproteobacteria bacterium]
MHADQMMAAHPTASEKLGNLAHCVEACFDCAQICTACADACLAEENPTELAACIRLSLDCADVCLAAGRILSRQTASQSALAWQVLETCAGFCRLCAAECLKHAGHHQHCRLCAEVCRACERACHRTTMHGPSSRA